jgi:hypothetical protein
MSIRFLTLLFAATIPFGGNICIFRLLLDITYLIIFYMCFVLVVDGSLLLLSRVISLVHNTFSVLYQLINEYFLKYRFSEIKHTVRL